MTTTAHRKSSTSIIKMTGRGLTLPTGTQASIEHAAIGLCEGASLNGVLCPFCGGGANGDRSFSITRTSSGVLYNCYRDSCRSVNSSSGFLGSLGFPRAGASIPSSFVPRFFTRDYETLPKAQEKVLKDAYGLVEVSDVAWCPSENRYAVWVNNKNMGPLGMMLRVPPGDKRKPKSIAYREQEGPWQAWYSTGDLAVTRGKTIVLVEDQWSAMRVVQAVPEYAAVALLGTHVSEEQAQDIADARPAKVIVALDKDATVKAFKIRMAYSLRWSMVLVCPLEQDIKDMQSDAAIRKMLCAY